MNRSSAVLQGVLAAAVLGVTVGAFSCLHKAAQDTQKYTAQRLPELISEIELRHGIRYDVAGSRRIPDVQGRIMERLASYNHETDTLQIYGSQWIRYRGVPKRPISKEGLSFEDVLTHEAGHAYHQRIIRLLQSTDTQFLLEPDARNPNDLAVIEGIGHYFMHRANPCLEETACELPSAVTGYFASAPDGRAKIYSCGYTLVAPILDSLGVAEGVARLTMSPPSDKELLSPTEYHERILALDQILPKLSFVSSSAP